MTPRPGLVAEARMIRGLRGELAAALRAVEARLQAEADPQLCTGCGAPLQRCQAARAGGAVACCPDCRHGHPEDVTPAGWLPGRGSYGTEYAGELVELVEARCCGQGAGCAHAGTRAAVKQVGGAGGTCVLLMLMSLPERVHGFVHDGGTVPDGAPDYAGHPAPLCTRYVEREIVRRGHRRRQETLPGL